MDAGEIADGGRPVRPGEELDAAALDGFLAEHLPTFTGPLRIEQFPGGFSNLTYLLHKGDDDLVLRRPPFGVQVKSGHDMGREFRVLCALHPVYPVTRPLAFCDDDAVLGAPFYVMERRLGLIVRKEMPRSFSERPALFRRVCEAVVDGLADLHAVDYEAVGLGGLGKPEGYVRRQVEGWIARFERAKTSDVPDMESIATWLRDNLPAQGEATLVHNDYKFDNVMLDPSDTTRIVAVLDWEMCTLGDPLMDLGVALGYWSEPGDDPVWAQVAFSPTQAPGSMTRREVAQRYADRTGRDVSNMLYYYCFALMKTAGVVQQIFYRYQAGHTRDPRFAGLDRVVRALARTAVGAAESGTY